MREVRRLVIWLVVVGLIVWSCVPYPPDAAFVETAAGLRIEVRAGSISPLGKAEFNLSAVFRARDGRTSGVIDLGIDSGGHRRTNLYRTPDGCLVLDNAWERVAVIEEPLAVAERGACQLPLLTYNRDCPDPAFDPATRPARPLPATTGYLGTFEYNMWRPGGGERLWLWQFHHAGDEPECNDSAGG